MNVKELQEHLEKFPYDAEVIIGVNLSVNGKPTKYGSEVVTAEDSDKNTVWLDMSKTVHITTASPHTELK